MKTQKNLLFFEGSHRHTPHVRLKKVTALMLASALLTSVSFHAGAQALKENISGDIDGKLKSGYLITGDERFEGVPNIVVGKTDSPSIVHNFNTVGGAGSGGGAGLGGAFFVDVGASLTVINTNFVSNRVQGGAGGSEPPVSYSDRIFNIQGATVNLDLLPVAEPDFSSNLAGVERVVANGEVGYVFNNLSVKGDVSKLIQAGSTVVFSGFDNATTSIEAIASGDIKFKDPVKAKATVISAYEAPAGNAVEVDGVKTGGTTGFVSQGGSIAISYAFDNQKIKKADPDDPNKSIEVDGLVAKDFSSALEVNQGDRIFFNGTTLATVRDVIFYTEEDDTKAKANGTLIGKPKELVLDTPAPNSITSLELVKQPSFDVIPFAVNGTDRTKVTSFDKNAKYLPGMSVTWEENGRNVTATVTAVSGNVVTLDKAVPQGVTGLKFVENPLVGDNSVRITGANTFKTGQVVYVPSADPDREMFVGKVTAIDTVNNIVTVTPDSSGQKLADYYDPSLGLALKSSAADVGSRGESITVPFNTTAYKNPADIEKLLKDRLVMGSSFEDGTKVAAVNVGQGTVTLTLSAPVNSSIVESFRLASPLIVGGSMNGIQVPDTIRNAARADGSNGISATSVSSFFNDAEGVDGTNGKSAGDHADGQGFNGGAGGNGSDGLPVNFWLVYDQTVASIGLKMATRNLVVAAEELALATSGLAEAKLELAAAIAPDPQGGLGFVGPDPAEIAAKKLAMTSATQEFRLKTKNKINANFDLGFAISDFAQATTHLTKWSIEMANGLAGLGGAGGDGGEASGGADFFGGGAGGAGGNGGAGARSITDGGDGGSGGRGGDGGFGAGGGQGGAGGEPGANGNAAGGDPGDGGYAGFGAGDGANGNGMFGGGGDGLGGSIFVRDGGSLLIQGNSHFTRNYVAGGSTSSQFGEAGSEAGTDLFMMKGSNVRLQPGLGKVIQFDGTIADDSFATNDGYSNAAGNGADIRIGGSGGGDGGLVIFNGENSYSGHTILEGANLTALVGTGVNDMSLIRFNGSGTTVAVFDQNKVNSTLSRDTVGTFLLQEDYERRAGMDPSETAWTGSGGFASGLQEGVTVTLGLIDSVTRRGQQLVWGEDGFFVPFDNGTGFSGVLTFGSELSEGAVEFTNNVDLNNKVGRIAVYNTGDLATSQATLSGQWGNTTGATSMLVVGDSSKDSPYNGTLFMTGQNQLDSLVVAGGTLTTYNPQEGGQQGALFKPTGDLIMLADKDNEDAVSRLHLFARESLHDVSVLGGGSLVLTQAVTASGDLVNLGEINVLGTDLKGMLEAMGAEKAAQMKVSLGLDYLPDDFSSWQAELTVSGLLSNSGSMVQTGKVNAGALDNRKTWVSVSEIAVKGDLINLEKGTFMVTANVSTETGNFDNAGAWDQTGDLAVGGSLTNRPDANLLQTGDIVVLKDLSNAGQWDQVGQLDVGATLTNTDAGSMRLSGHLNVTADVVNEGQIVHIGDHKVTGSWRNTGDISITGSTAIGGDLENRVTETNAGTLVQTGSLTVGGSLSNAGLMSVTGNTAVTGSVVNTGSLLQSGDMTVKKGLTHDGLWRFGQDASLSTGVLSGGGVFCLASGADLDCQSGVARTVTMTLAEDSTFNGLIAGSGKLIKSGDTSRLVLTKDQSFSGGLVIEGGTVAAMGTMSDSLDITVGTKGTYEVHKADTVRSVTNNGNNSVYLYADLTATAGYQNNGRTVVQSLELGSSPAHRTLDLVSSGLSGATTGVFVIDRATTLHVKQEGSTAYAGSFVRADDDSALVKEGTGTLTLSGQIDLRYVTVSKGELALAKEKILSQDAIVNIKDEATLSLLTGDQEIEQLIGEGFVNLNANRLLVSKGGGFVGQISGTGQVVVESGEFAVAGAIESPDAGFTVQSGSTVSVSSSGSLNVKTLTVEDNGILSLGSKAQPGGTITASDVQVSGQLSGSGTVSGATVVRNGGRLSPGYSPGTIVFNDGLSLENGSTIVMEIADATRAAGDGFDQVVIGQGKSFKLSPGAQLDMDQIGSFQASSLQMGQTLKLFDFSPGMITGTFGTVRLNQSNGNPVPNPNVVLNLATGSVVGLGDRTLQDIAAVAVTPNERAIYQGLQKGSNGGVGQFYGGHFVEHLTSAIADNGSTRAVFNAYDPEVYQSLTDLAQDTAQAALPSWKSTYLGQDAFVAFTGNTSKATGRHSDHQAFGIRYNSSSIGYARALGDKSLMFTFGTVNARTESQLMRNSGDGFNGSVALLGRFASLPSTTWHLGLGLSDLKMDGSRTTLAGSTSFKDVGVRSTSLESGFETRHSFGNSAYVMGRGAIVLGNSRRDAIAESGAPGGVDAMQLAAISRSYTGWDAGLELGVGMTPKTVWYGSLGLQGSDVNASELTAGFDNNQALVSVQTRSALRSNSKLMTGLRYRNEKGTTIEAAIGGTKGWDNKTEMLGRLSVHMPF